MNSAEIRNILHFILVLQKREKDSSKKSGRKNNFKLTL